MAGGNRNIKQCGESTTKAFPVVCSFSDVMDLGDKMKNKKSRNYSNS